MKMAPLAETQAFKRTNNSILVVEKLKFTQIDANCKKLHRHTKLAYLKKTV